MFHRTVGFLLWNNKQWFLVLITCQGQKWINSQPTLLKLVGWVITIRSNIAMGNNYLAGSYYPVLCDIRYITTNVFEVWLQWNIMTK